MDSQRFGYFFFLLRNFVLVWSVKTISQGSIFQSFCFFFFFVHINMGLCVGSISRIFIFVMILIRFLFFRIFSPCWGEGNVEIKVFDWINKTKETLTIWLFSFRRLVNISIFEFYLAQIIVPKEPIEFPISFKFDEIWLKFENNSVRNSFDCRKFYRKQILFF